MDTLRAFAVEPAKNGGLVVSEQSSVPGRMNDVVGAFSSPADMIRWLCEQYRLPADAIFATGGVAIVTERVGERASESIVPADDGLCHDEGCPHHGTAHVCVNWISWSGHSMLDCDKGLPCMIRMRDGKERAGKTFDHVERWRWSLNAELLMNDVVAYRVVAAASSKAWADRLNDPTVAAAISDHSNRHA